MKDVAACEKLRGAGKRALIRRCPNGETRPTLNWLSRARQVRARARLRKPSVGDGMGEPIECGSPFAEFIGKEEQTR